MSQKRKVKDCNSLHGLCGNFYENRYIDTLAKNIYK